MKDETKAPETVVGFDNSTSFYPVNPSKKLNFSPVTKGSLANATQNACKMCTPLGACLAFAGVKNCISVLHGSQGCATYIRRYLISHFREPMDIASSSFSEHDAIFGGGNNLKLGIDNVVEGYSPSIVGVATTCLAETIGEDVPAILKDYKDERSEREDLPHLIHVSTASYMGDHSEGFHKTVHALVDQLAEKGETEDHINVMPGMVSCEDIRYLKEILKDFGLKSVLFPDYSDTMDGGSWDQYNRIPEGGTSLDDLRKVGRARASLEFGAAMCVKSSAGKLLEESYGISRFGLGLPIGISETDKMFEALEQLAVMDTPELHRKERERLVDAYVDGHKYLFGKKVAIFGDPDLVIGLASFITEIGMIPIICATGAKTPGYKEILLERTKDCPEEITILTGADHAAINDKCRELRPDLLLGNSKGYPIARDLKIPLMRCGLPVHDRIGGQRVLHLGYRGAQRLFDQIVNIVLDTRQEESPVGFSYQ